MKGIGYWYQAVPNSIINTSRYCY